MFAAAVGLGLVAIALAWPVPILLSAARWPARAPGVALALWQSIALAGGLSMIGALLAYGLLPFGATLPDGILSMLGHLSGGALPADTSFSHVLALSAALMLGTHLLLNLATTFARAERQRRRHLHLIGLLSEPLPDLPGTRVIAHPAPVAYCLPGATRSATVLSEGLLRLLDADQVRGVIEHERAHVRQQHHLVLLAFRSWRSALPWFPIANRAENSVGLLVEMLADDQARRLVDDRTLATAIALVGSSGHTLPGASPTFTASPAEPEHPLVAPRVSRLLTPQPPLPRAAGLAAGAAAAGLLVLPALLLYFA